MAAIWRAGLVVVALVVCAWFALSARQAVNTNRAAALVGSGSLTASQAQHADSLLSAAGTLNPDLTPDILRGQLALQRGEYQTALADLESVTRREPLNLGAWSALAYTAARAGERGTLIRAAHHISILFPKLPR